MENTNKKVAQMELELGDIIEIISPSNSKLHQKHFYIDYIDDEIVEIINISTGESQKLNKTSNKLDDESITAISLLSRSDEKGYVKQNNLTLYTWVDVHIGGNEPIYIIGKITNIEEDCIEITTVQPVKDIIYIDFEYKGIPKNIPFKSITIREPMDSPEETKEIQEDGVDVETPDEDIKDILKAQYLESNDIVFGEDLEDVKQFVEIPEHKKTYALGIQLNDLLDEFLSIVPNSARTNKKMRQIHILIERYKQLRHNFSIFDENENVKASIFKGPLYKPLVEKLKKFDFSNKWIVPVVTNRKKIFKEKLDENDEDEHMVNLVNFEDDLQDILNIFENSENTRVYTSIYKRLNEHMTPYDIVNCANCFADREEAVMDFDSLIDNDGNFGSNVFHMDKGEESTPIMHANTQRHIMSLMEPRSSTSKSGAVTYKKEPITNNDLFSLKSFVLCPFYFIEKNKMYLPGTNMKKRVEYNEYSHLQNECFENIQTSIIDDLNKEHDEYDEMKLDFFKHSKHYIIDDILHESDDKYNAYLNYIIPKTKTLFLYMKNKMSHKYSFSTIAKELECFDIQTKDISYKQHDSIRFYIKEQIKSFNEEYNKNKKTFNGYVSYKSGEKRLMNTIEKLLFDNEDITQMFRDGYKIDPDMKFSTYETLNNITNLDYCNLFYTLIYYATFRKLTTPDDLLPSFEPAKIDDMDYKIDAKKCLRRYLSKKYESISDLQGDNGQEIYYDSEYDDTPYFIRDLYKKEEKAMDAAKFKSFLLENLKSKHMSNIESIDPAYLEELAETLMRRQKKVDEGAYAILSIKPKLPKELKLDELSSREQEEVKIEEEVREKTSYYVRMKNQWVQDNDISEEVFYDNNTLFCNISESCMKNTQNNMCESKQMSKMRMADLQKSRITKEYEKRVNMSFDQTQSSIKETLLHIYKHNNKMKILNEIALMRYNNYSYNLGLSGSLTEEMIVSPYVKLINKILGQADFVKKNSDILKFIDTVCREPMYDVEIEEDKHWYYCKQTNTKLLPRFFGELANAYFSNNYYEVLMNICSKHGKLSDDGDSIVDEHSGLEIMKREYVATDEYNEEGFRVITSEVMTKDMNEILEDSLEEIAVNDGVQLKPRVLYESEETQTIYNVCDKLCEEMGFPIEDIKDFVIFYTTELNKKNIKTRAIYEKAAADLLEKKGKSSIPYDIYKNRLMFWFLSCSLIIAIQTHIPSFEVNNSRKMRGYPFTGIENETSLNYMAEVLHKLKNQLVPWNSIEKMKKMQIKEVIDKFYISRSDIENLYKIKNEYLVKNPDKVIIREHNVSNWTGFLPPIVPYEVSVKNVSESFKKEFVHLLKTGHRDQHQNIGVYQSRIISHSYNIIKLVNDIILKKTPLLTTATKEPFLENACCNENFEYSMKYFENENPIIGENIVSIRKLSDTLLETNNYTFASILHHLESTRTQFDEVKDIVDEALIYDTIIYYNNLRSDLPIPQNLLYMFSSKPGEFPSKSSLEEQIQFLKMNGFKFKINDFHLMMMNIHYNKILRTSYLNEYHEKQIVLDILDGFDRIESSIIDAKFRELLRSMLEEYNPQKMFIEEKESSKKFKNYLARANENMYRNIVDFIDDYGNLNDKEFDKFQEYLLNITNDENISLINIIKFIQNSIYLNTKNIPSILLNSNDIYKQMPEHWDFSDFHNANLKQKMENYWIYIQQFKDNKILMDVLREVMYNLNQLNLFMKNIPMQMPLEKNDNVFISLFDNETIHLLYIYLWYSTYYEYVVSANKPDNLNANLINKKQQAKAMNETLKDQSLQTKGFGVDESYELDVEMTNQEDLLHDVGKLLVAFYNMEMKSKYVLSNYDSIMKSSRKLKNIEKTKITDDLGKLDKFNLAMEDEMKKYKLGKWSVGLEKSLFQYDKATYDKNAEAVEAIVLEGYDISDLPEDFMDGNPYGDEIDEF